MCIFVSCVLCVCDCPRMCVRCVSVGVCSCEAIYGVRDKHLTTQHAPHRAPRPHGRTSSRCASGATPSSSTSAAARPAQGLRGRSRMRRKHGQKYLCACVYGHLPYVFVCVCVWVGGCVFVFSLPRKGCSECANWCFCGTTFAQRLCSKERFAVETHCKRIL